MKRSTLMIAAPALVLGGIAMALAQAPAPPAQPRQTGPAGGGGPPAGYGAPAGLYVQQIPRWSPDHEADQKVSTLVQKWKASEDDAGRGEVERELREALKTAFESRLTAHEHQIQELETRVKELREQLDRRREKQAEIVDFRLQQLLREAQGLGWGGDVIERPGPAPGFGTFAPGPTNVPGGFQRR